MSAKSNIYHFCWFDFILNTMSFSMSLCAVFHKTYTPIIQKSVYRNKIFLVFAEWKSFREWTHLTFDHVPLESVKAERSVDYQTNGNRLSWIPLTSRKKSSPFTFTQAHTQCREQSLSGCPVVLHSASLPKAQSSPWVMNRDMLKA